MSSIPNLTSVNQVDDSAVVVKFGRNGNITTLPNAGFDLADGEQSSWTEQQTAWFEVTPRWPAKDLNLSFAASPFLVGSRISHQHVFIYVNGLFCGLVTLFEPRECDIHVPRNTISGRSTRITFAIPTAQSPQRLGISEDIRTLGIALTTLTLSSN